MAEVSGIYVVLPVTERLDEPRALFRAYREALASVAVPLQFIYVLDGRFSYLASEFRQLSSGPEELVILTLPRVFGESAALTIGFERAKYDLVMTLPAYQQVDAASLPRLLEEIGNADMVVTRRWPRCDSRINQFSARVFNSITRAMIGSEFRDLGCAVRLIRRKVLAEVSIYGDQHRFLPLLAARRGLRVAEMDLPQARSEQHLRVYRPGVYFSRLLDLLGVFFIARFTKKPLRFFGMVGSVLLSVGVVILIVAVVERYLADTALADRPVLLLGSLFVVLGFQLFALGLIGELIIFTHARDLKEYAVAETVNLGYLEKEPVTGRNAVVTREP